MTGMFDISEETYLFFESVGSLPKSGWPDWAEGYVALKPDPNTPEGFVVVERMLFGWDVVSADEGGKGLPTSYRSALSAAAAFRDWPQTSHGWTRTFNGEGQAVYPHQVPTWPGRESNLETE